MGHCAYASWACALEYVSNETTFSTLASVRHLKESETERRAIHEKAALLKSLLRNGGLPVAKSPSHIVPVMVGDATKSRSVADILLREHGVYVQQINYPTVPRGTERLRLTPSPVQTQAMMDKLVRALTTVRKRHHLEIAA